MNDRVCGTLDGLTINIAASPASSRAAFLAAKTAYESACAKLAGLRGTNGSSLAGIDAFLSKYRDLVAQERGVASSRVSVPSDLDSAFRSAWSRLGVDDKDSFSKALRKMQSVLKADADDAHGSALLAAQNARQDELEAQQAYRAACAAFIDGTGTQADVATAAQRAYRESPWVGKAEQWLASSVLDTASFSAGVLQNDSEAAARLGAVQQYAQSIVAVFGAALDSRGARLQQEWDQSLQDLQDRQQAWYAQVGLVRAKAASSWDSSQQKLVRFLGEWRQGFQQEYQDKSEAWRMAYLDMSERELQWVHETQEKASKVGNEAILSEVGASADDSARAASTLMVSQMSFDAKETNLRVEGLLGEVGSAQALTALRRMNAGIADGQVVVASGRLRAESSGARIAAEVKRFLQVSRDEVSALAARGIADQAQESVEEAKKALAESVKRANEGFERSMDETFVPAGYARTGGEYRREAIVRSMWLSSKSETQQVGTYRWYAMPTLQINVDLSQTRLKGLGAQAVTGLVGAAQQEVVQAQKKVFGDGRKLSDAEKNSKGLLFEFSANGTLRDKGARGRGFWQIHRVRARLQQHAGLRQAAGQEHRRHGHGRTWSPDGRLRLEPDEGKQGVVRAVDARLGQAAVGRHGTSASGGLFNGFSGASNGFLRKGIAGSLGQFGDGVLGKTLLAGTQAFTTNTAASAVNAVTWSNGRVGWDTNAFTEAAFGRSAVASAIGASAGALTTASLKKVLNAADNKFYSGAVSLAGAAATELGRYGTYLGSEYASGNAGSFRDVASRAYDSMGGVTLNVANLGAIADLAGTGIATSNGTGQSALGRYSQLLAGTGLVEMNFGSKGVTARLGTGGTDVAGGAYRLAKGLVDRSILENYAASDNERGTIAMNAYVYGDWTAENTARRLGVGRDQMVLGFDGANGAVDDRTRGYTQSNGRGGRTIFVRNMGSGTAALQNMAVTLQHEAYRDTLVNGNNGQETYQAVRAHAQIAAAMLSDKQTGFMDRGLAQDLNALGQGDAVFREYVGENYKSEDEFWKAVLTSKGLGMKADGKTTFDVSDLIEGGGTSLASLDDETIQQLWQIQQEVVSGATAGGAELTDEEGVFYRPEFADYAEFAVALQQYNSASQRINETMGLFNGTNAPDQVATQSSLTETLRALEAVQRGGLLVKMDAVIANPGPGRHIFATSLGETLTSKYGYRIETWNIGEPIAMHRGWDAVAIDPRLVAPDAGNLKLEYGQAGGLTSQFTDEAALNRDVRMHLDPSSVTQFLSTFGMVGTALNANVLSGMQQNMVVGKMGNSGEKRPSCTAT